jgi:hypothetical protein
MVTRFTTTMTTVVTSTPSCFQVLVTTATVTDLGMVPICGTTQPPTTSSGMIIGRKKREVDFIDQMPIEDEFDDGDNINPSKVG